ncbi:MAG: hypothetical protein CMI26_03220 [Opitutae bacterium]|nr:hypothetical protein [Opitutae bacterium]
MPRKKLSSLNQKKVRRAWFNPDWMVVSSPCRSSFWMIPAIHGLLIVLTPACTESDLIKDDNSTWSSPPTFENLALDSDPFVNAETKDSQLAVLHALFDPKTGYRLPGTYDKAKLEALFLDIRAGYFVKTEGIDEHIRREYHTFTHALDIVVTIHGLLREGGAVFLNEHEQSALVLAALAHDVLHCGVSNAFLINVNHPLATKWGAKSLQERRSADHTLMLLDKHKVLVAKDGMEDSLKNSIADTRTIIEEAILWTDMARHKEQMEKVAAALGKVIAVLEQVRKGGIGKGGATVEDVRTGVNVASLLDKETRILLAAFFLHCADISNPSKDWVLCERWAVIVMNEFFSQGDVERKLGHKLSMNCDRESVSVSKCQLGFGTYVIRSLLQLLEKLVYTAGSKSLENFEANHKHWEEIAKKEAESGKPYLMKLNPPSKEGGWLGELREGEDRVPNSRH